MAWEKEKSSGRRRASSGRCKERETQGRKREKKEMRNLGAGLIVWEKGKSSEHRRESNGRCKERET